MILQRAMACIDEGADVLDIGGESSRPGSDYVGEDEEIARVIPLIEQIRQRSDIAISVDTRKYEVAAAAVEAGANIINDISALRDDARLGPFIAERELPVVLMHMQGTPRNMQMNPTYHDVIQQVIDFLKARIDVALSLGIACERIILDPGIGFGKNFEHNLLLLKHLDQIVALGFPVLMGHSRKGFIGRILAGESADSQQWPPAKQRLFGSLGVVADSYYRGARIFRVHDVQPTRELLEVCVAIDKSAV